MTNKTAEDRTNILSFNPNMAKVEVTLTLFFNKTKYEWPDKWPWNDILGFEGIGVSGARVAKTTVRIVA